MNRLSYEKGNKKRRFYKRTNEFGTEYPEIIAFRKAKSNKEKPHKYKEILEMLLEKDDNNNPEDYVIKLYIGKCHVELNEYEQAENIFIELIRTIENNTNNDYKSPNNNQSIKHSAYFEYGKLCLSKKDLEKAEESFKKCGERDVFARLEIGKIYLQQKKYDEAIKEFEACIKLRPDDRFAYYHLAQALRSKGEEQELIEQNLRKHLELNPKDQYALFDLGECLRKQGKLYDAQSYLKKAIELNKNDMYSHYEMGLVYKELGLEYKDKNDLENAKKEFKSALDEFNKCIELADKNKKRNSKILKKQMYAYYERGRLYRELGNLIEAKKDLKKSLKMFKGENSGFVVQYELGKICLEMGEDENALNAFEIFIEKAEQIRKDGNNVYDDRIRRTYFEIAKLYRKNGDLVKAKDYANKSLNMHTKGEPVFIHLELGLLDAMSNNDETAKQLYFSLIKYANNAKDVFNQIMNQLEEDVIEENHRVFKKENIKDTLESVKNSIENGEYQFIKGYGCDFYIIKVDDCGYSNNVNGDNYSLNYVSVCTIPDSKKIIAMIPISGIEELGEQSKNLIYTMENVKGAIIEDNRELSQRTLKVRDEIAKKIKSYLNMLVQEMEG